MKSPQNPNLTQKTLKPYFFYGHRKPSRNRPVVHGGLFSNRQSAPKERTADHQKPFDLSKWDPHVQSTTAIKSPVTSPSPDAAERLSPIARFIVDAFRRNHNRWGPLVVSELNKLRRVTPKLVTEVLKVQNSSTVASKFFHWAGKQKGYRHDFASYNAFAYCLNRNGLFRAADQLPELMDSHGKPPSEKQFEILIRMHADNNRGLRVYYVYEKMKKFGVRPRVFLYNRIMDALIKSGYLDLALSVYEDFRGDGLVEESITYMILVKGLCKAGRTEEMFEILHRMRENLCRPDVFAYTAMIRALVSEGNMEDSLRVWDEMKRDKVEPDMMAYGTIATGLCKAGRTNKGYELFKEMKKKGILIDRSLYRDLIDGFVAEKKVGSACDLLKDLLDSGYVADLGIYNSIIKGLCDVKRVDKAYKLFQVVMQDELEPDFETINPMLKAYAEMKQMEDFLKLLDKIKKLGHCVDDFLSRFFWSVCAEQEGISMAIEVLEAVKVKGFSSVSIYNILMDALYEIGESDKSLLLFSEMKDFELEPDSSTYSVAIKCFTEKGQIQEACTCHNKIIEMSCVPSVSAYYTLGRGLCKIGEIDAAMMLIRDCLGNIEKGPMEFKYALMIIHVCRTGDSEKVIEVLDEMRQERICIDEIAYCAIISGMCKNRTIEEARKIFTKLREVKVMTEADTVVYDEILIEHMKKKTADLVLSGLKFFGLESKLKAKGCTVLAS